MMFMIIVIFNIIQKKNCEENAMRIHIWHNKAPWHATEDQDLILLFSLTSTNYHRCNKSLLSWDPLTLILLEPLLWGCLLWDPLSVETWCRVICPFLSTESDFHLDLSMSALPKEIENLDIPLKKIDNIIIPPMNHTHSSKFQHAT